MKKEKKKGSCLGSVVKVILILLTVGGIGIYGFGAYAGLIPDYGGVVETVVSILPGHRVTPEVKEMMDDYESFIDEYIEFMEKYKDSEDMASLLDDYNDYMARYAEVMEHVGTINQEELSEADIRYYTKVNLRVLKKLADAEITE